MLRINPIKNVNNTLNYRPSFKSGVQTNYGLEFDEKDDRNLVENGFIAGFSGIIRKSVQILSPKIKDRAKSIRDGVEATRDDISYDSDNARRLDKIA